MTREGISNEKSSGQAMSARVVVGMAHSKADSGDWKSKGYALIGVVPNGLFKGFFETPEAARAPLRCRTPEIRQWPTPRTRSRVRTIRSATPRSRASRISRISATVTPRSSSNSRISRASARASRATRKNKARHDLPRAWPIWPGLCASWAITTLQPSPVAVGHRSGLPATMPA